MSESAFLPLVVPRVGDEPVDVRGETERARSRGYADGFAEGRRIALEQAAEEQAAEQARMQQLIDGYLHQRGSVLSALQKAHSLLEERVGELAALTADRIEGLALELATAILGAELSDPARSAGHAVHRALAEMPVDRWTRVTFSERDAATLAADPGTQPLLRGVELSGSPAVDAGGALIEIEDGAVDTRIAQALARASAALHADDDTAPVAS
ncbi:FliH/SctL family protein [Microbacterium sp. 3J1]|uniref:FliH/SctL family protein n=1 Tax=Microbacterium sp. 3J1 TaxID=861269 RepID=UPI0011461F1B|nr:FliH/SctL family protein [Microbacterium sp. 3J1]